MLFSASNGIRYAVTSEKKADIEYRIPGDPGLKISSLHFRMGPYGSLGRTGLPAQKCEMVGWGAVATSVRPEGADRIQIHAAWQGAEPGFVGGLLVGVAALTNSRTWRIAGGWASGGVDGNDRSGGNGGTALGGIGALVGSLTKMGLPTDQAEAVDAGPRRCTGGPTKGQPDACRNGLAADLRKRAGEQSPPSYR